MRKNILHQTKTVALTLALLLTATLAFAQPVVTTIVPSAGPVGSSVVITGSSFGAAAANNIVYFGAVRGSITLATASSITVTVPAGATPGPITVLNTTTGLQAISLTTFKVTFSGGAVNQCAFNNDITEFAPTGGSFQPFYFAAADFNNDGKTELLFMSTYYNYICYVTNKSVPGSLTGASFSDTTRLTIGPGSEQALSIATADIDGDGRIDVVVGEGGSLPGIGVFRNTSVGTTISFAAKQQFSGLGTALAIGDLDFDGKPEVVANGTVYRNTSTIGNINFVAVSLSSSLGSYISVGDLDGDHKPDVAYIAGQYLYVIRNVGTAAPFTNAFFGSGVLIGSFPLVSLAVTDIDGDNKPEIITMNNYYGQDTIYVYRNIATSGTLNTSSFAPRISIALGYDPTGTSGISDQVITGDVDGDGKTDIIGLDRTAITNPNAQAIGVFTNKTTPGVITSASFGREFYEVGTRGSTVLTADLDVDGRLDLVTSYSNGNSYVVAVLRNTMTESSCSLTVATPAPVISSFAPAAGNAGTSVVITGTNFNSTLSKNAVYFGGIKANVTAGSGTSLTVTVPTGINRERLIVLDVQTHQQAMSTNYFSATFGTTHTLTSASFNANQEFLMATNLSGAEINYSGLADYDNDGKYDIIHQYESFSNVHITRNQSTPSTYSFPVDGLMRKQSTYGYAIPSSDLDGDGRTDMIASDFYELSIWKNKYAGGLLDSTSFSGYQNRIGGSFDDMVFPGIPADMDGDGRPDLVLTGVKGPSDGAGSFSILRNLSSNGSITFSSKIIFPQTIGDQVALGDFNGDNKFDFVVPDGTSSNTLLVYQNNSTIGNISPATFTKTTVSVGGTLYHYLSVDVADIDGDGKQDIVLGHDHGVTIVRNIYSGGPITAASFAAPFEITNSSIGNEACFRIADLDGDGKPDLVTEYIDSFYLYKNTATPGTIDATSFAAPLAVFADALKIEVADINGDGRPELIGFAEGYMTIYYPAGAPPPPNQPPVLSTTTTTEAYVGAPLIVDNQLSVSDADDANLTGATMTIGNVLPEDVLTFTNQNGISGVYNAGAGSMTLTGTSSVANYQTALRSVHYNNTAGTPTQTTRSIELFATDGKAPSNTITYSITFSDSPPADSPPVIAISPVTVTAKGKAIIYLTPDISDPDGNLELQTLTITSPPQSGAPALITAGDSLIVDYSGLSFSGTDQLTIQVCDSEASCTQQAIQINVVGQLIIYNGISANGDQLNPYFRIENIEVFQDTQNNHVSIYNRWGDVVYEVDDYDNASRVFKGVNKNGSELPAGTYFYKIDFQGGRKAMTGYLSLKR